MPVAYMCNDSHLSCLFCWPPSSSLAEMEGTRIKHLTQAFPASHWLVGLKSNFCDPFHLRLVSVVLILLWKRTGNYLLWVMSRNFTCTIYCGRMHKRFARWFIIQKIDRSEYRVSFAIWSQSMTALVTVESIRNAGRWPNDSSVRLSLAYIMLFRTKCAWEFASLLLRTACMPRRHFVAEDENRNFAVRD